MGRFAINIMAKRGRIRLLQPHVFARNGMFRLDARARNTKRLAVSLLRMAGPKHFKSLIDPTCRRPWPAGREMYSIALICALGD